MNQDSRLTSSCKRAIESLVQEAYTCLYVMLLKQISGKRS